MDLGGYVVLQIILLVVRIIITVYCVNRAGELNRSKTGWGFFGFFFPIIAIIWIQFMKPISLYKKKYGLIQNEEKEEQNESNTESKTIETYLTPNHTIRKIDERNPLFGTKTEVYFVEFEDGVNGEVFLEITDKQHAYFKAKVNDMWIKSQFRYENIDSCIIAFHYYVKTGKTYKDGFICATT